MPLSAEQAHPNRNFPVLYHIAHCITFNEVRLSERYPKYSLLSLGTHKNFPALHIPTMLLFTEADTFAFDSRGFNNFSEILIQGFSLLHQHRLSDHPHEWQNEGLLP